MEGRAASVIRLQQHVRNRSSQAVHELCPTSGTAVPITALWNSGERFTQHHVDLQLSAGPPSHPKTITCHRETRSRLPSNMLFSKGQSSKTCSSSGYNPSSISQPKQTAHAPSCANIAF